MKHLLLMILICSIFGFKSEEPKTLFVVKSKLIVINPPQAIKESKIVLDSLEYHLVSDRYVKKSNGDSIPLEFRVTRETYMDAKPGDVILDSVNK